MPASDILTRGVEGGISGAPGGLPGVAAGAVVGLASGLFAWLIDSGHEAEAAAIQKEAADRYGEISDESVKAAAAKILGPTALAKIQLDPKYRAAQDESLAQLSRIGRDGGYTLADKANLENTREGNAAEASSAQRGILAGLSRRGMAGSSAEVAADMAGAQNAANRNSREGLQITATGQDRALRAIMDAGTLGGQIEDRSYGQQADAAKAQDSIDRFNNSEQYNRANADYNRRLGMLDHQYGFASDQANTTRAAGQRAAGVVGGVGNAVQQGVTGAARNGLFDSAPPPTTTPAAGGGSDTAALEQQVNQLPDAPASPPPRAFGSEEDRRDDNGQNGWRDWMPE